MEDVRFAVIGNGNIGGRHIAFLLETQGAIIHTVCDVDEDRARKGAEVAGCRYCTDFEEVLSDPDVDVIDICTPSGLHAEMSVQAMEAGKHAISEKPMALSLTDADMVIETEKRTGRKYFLVKQNRYNPPVLALRKVMEQGNMGDVFMISSEVYWNRRRAYYDDENWRGTLRLDGGALFTQSSHFIDLIIWLGGIPKSVTSTMKNIEHPYIETEDLGSLRIEFENGCVAVMNYTTATFGQNLEGSITVLGTGGSVKVGGKYLNELTQWNVGGIEKPDLPPGRPPNTYKGGYQGSMSNHDKVLRNVVEVLRGNEEKSVLIKEGRLTVEVMQAAHISALEGRPVDLPLSEEEYSFDLSKSVPFPER